MERWNRRAISDLIMTKKGAAGTAPMFLDSLPRADIDSPHGQAADTYFVLWIVRIGRFLFRHGPGSRLYRGSVVNAALQGYAAIGGAFVGVQYGCQFALADNVAFSDLRVKGFGNCYGCRDWCSGEGCKYRSARQVLPPVELACA